MLLEQKRRLWCGRGSVLVFRLAYALAEVVLVLLVGERLGDTQATLARGNGWAAFGGMKRKGWVGNSGK